MQIKKLVIKSGVYFLIWCIFVNSFGSILNGLSLYKQKNNYFSFAVWILNWHGMSLIIISCAVSGFPLLPTIRKSVGREVLESYFSARHKENGLLQQQKMRIGKRPRYYVDSVCKIRLSEVAYKIRSRPNCPYARL